MAQKVSVVLLDDLDGGEADETVQFGIDGVSYEIDLSTPNADGLREVLEKYTAVGRRTGGRKVTSRGVGAIPRNGVPKQGGSDLTYDERASLRIWASDQGIHVAERGRIAASVIERWREAGSPAAA